MNKYSLEIHNGQIQTDLMQCDDTNRVVDKARELMKSDKTIFKIEISWEGGNKIIYERPKTL